MAKNVTLSIPGMDTEGRGAPESGFILVVEGLEATGKSRLAMTGPSGIAYFSLNIGSDRVIDEAREGGKEIAHGDFEYSIPKVIRTKLGRAHIEYWEKIGAELMKKNYGPFLDKWEEVYEEDDVRTMVQDRCDEFWELAQRANFGKLEANSQTAYGPITDEFITPIKMAKKAGKLVILIHELKQEYKSTTDPESGREKSTMVVGKFKRGGCRHIAGLADAIVRLHYIPEGTKATKDSDAVEEDTFQTEIVLSKHAMEWNRQRVDTTDIPSLMGFLKPKVDQSVWED